MKNNTEITLQGFTADFDNQPFWLQKKLRKDIMYRCGWKSRTTFQNKLKGETPIKPPEKAVIRELFKAHDIEVSIVAPVCAPAEI
ncbi:MAG: hypothetical protein OEY01_11215 [Desulfobulbaceae bacterium]|nr:hypothetical protein [Desulfobulbaceae bacterium]